MKQTRINLQIALAAEADANRRYLAYGVRALQEGYPEIAQLFFEAAGAETVHAYSHLVALDAIGTTNENLRRAARGERGEVEQMYPRMIAEAESEAAQQAAASFRLALEREKHHQQMFRRALASFEEQGTRSERDDAPPRSAEVAIGESPIPHTADRLEEGRQDITQPARVPGPLTPETLAASLRSGQRRTTPYAARPGLSAPVDRRAVKRGLREMESERERIGRLAEIREVVFGGQDGLISTTTLVAGIAATTSQQVVVLVAGTIAAIAGALSMAVGSYLSSRAQRQVYEAELAAEWQEIQEKPGEEMAELLAALMSRGMPRHDALEVMRRVAAHPRLLLEMLGTFELGLTPQSLGSPLRDALVMAGAFVIGSAIPLAPFLVLGVRTGLIVTMLLALGALFALGVVKAWLSGRSMLASGLEVMVCGGVGGAIGYMLGRLVSTLFGVHI